MALRRYRVAQYPGRFVVLDHGPPVGDRTVTVGPNQAMADEQVPLYRQDGNPEDPRSAVFVVWAADTDDADGLAAAQERANRLNADWEQESDAHDEVLSELDYQPGTEQQEPADA